MRSISGSLFVAAALAIAGPGCRGTDRADQDVPSEPADVAIAEITVDELDRMLAAGDGQAVDANGEPTRRKLGVIPGAVLLADMDSLDNLPADRTRRLVFYCANTSCGASHHAAAKALAAGYTRVQVLPAGIAGWVKAGKSTTSI
jgi:rhodanese-related sulfurtransferase